MNTYIYVHMHHIHHLLTLLLSVHLYCKMNIILHVLKSPIYSVILYCFVEFISCNPYCSLPISLQSLSVISTAVYLFLCRVYPSEFCCWTAWVGSPGLQSARRGCRQVERPSYLETSGRHSQLPTENTDTISRKKQSRYYFKHSTTTYRIQGKTKQLQVHVFRVVPIKIISERWNLTYFQKTSTKKKILKYISTKKKLSALRPHPQRKKINWR